MSGELANLQDRVVIIGSGLAGLVTALCLRPQPVLLLTRADLGAESSSQWAQGGIAASLGSDDCAALHAEDTLKAGDGLCDTAMVRLITEQAPAAIAMLESYGVRFDRDGTGAIALGLEAAHSRRRIVHAGGDASGAALVRTLAAAVKNSPSIDILSGCEVRRLIVDEGRIAGLLGATAKGALRLAASRVVLATGGLGGLFDATTNPQGNYGQGIMLAARAGAVLADMEFVQFHPTALDSARTPLALISEAVRGEGAVLINPRGERFMADVTGAELAPRDVVARAISTERQKGGKVFLDACQALGAGFSARFPAIDALCREAGIDPANEPIPVRPAAHYHMGGVATDSYGRTSIEGLWAAGEVACTGLHGANRLASNSLLEAVVMGKRVAEAMMVAKNKGVHLPDMAMPPDADLRSIRPVVSAHLGVLRHEAGLAAAVRAVLPMALAVQPASDPAMIALLMAVFAHRRCESRGGHARTDFPSRLAASCRQEMTLGEALDAAVTILSSSPTVQKRSA
ncbi:L-aspartate oxidase [Allorhizobium sp. BGMRC 0089]|uniref:L-aspartate oxidase n=1 Tax=Allorhizobium sonneratiae TaxID=2934936 RepID=UPI002034845A|nr:L-aspartate oxidase [Allorhizobium sonneratiae]MCM2292772.1 L-aspartate oxidase [Allorhizobium sonneratiae]